jgi:hypothetical protein
MGKKSRLKRERREGQTDTPVRGSAQARPQRQDLEFRAQIDGLRGYLTRFAAVDVLVSLGVSELWRPNRSSQVKHTFATLIAMSTPPAAFRAGAAIDTYEDFAGFLDGLGRLLPRFPLLEDFVPEADWGEVRVAGAQDFEPIFYGGSVERIPDFIEAFRLLEGDEAQALADINLAVALQAHIIRSVEAGVVGSDQRVRAGHIEVPSADFWQACRAALQTAWAAVKPLAQLTSESLTVELGALRCPDSSAHFGDSILTGTALPVMFASVAGTVVPLSPRSATAVVVDLWDKRSAARAPETLKQVGRRLGGFLTKRFRQHDVVPGPARVMARSHRFDYDVAAVVRSGARICIILVLNPDQVQQLAQIEKRLQRVVDESDRWGLALVDTRQIAEFRNSAGAFARANDVQIIAVLARVTTQPTVLGLPETKARVMGLPDFVSLFDALEKGEELERFWAYLDDLGPRVGGFAGLIDHFASFRDTHAVLIDGAISPDYISLDPHWNSNWRFEQLRAFWTDAPDRFPDDQATWVIERKNDGLTTLTAKGPLALVWSGNAGACTVQALMEIDTVANTLDEQSGRLLELFVHCLADVITQRGALLAAIGPLRRQQIVIRCTADPDTLLALDDEVATAQRAGRALFDGWQILNDDGVRKLVVSTRVNLSRLHEGVNEAKDASFEAECTIGMVLGLSALLGEPVDEALIDRLRATSQGPPRFTIRVTQRTVDVPDFASPWAPEAEQFKRARKELAFVFKAQGVAAPARFELEPAKQVMNAARDAMRNALHGQVGRYDRVRLAQMCIEQHDEATAKYRHEVTRLKLSMSHQVSFDRQTELAEAHEKYTSMARNNRYLLECCLSLNGNGTETPNKSDFLELAALADWLAVLYGASDTLHNEIDVGGIELDDSYVPTVFFSEDRDEKERQYLADVASAKLGIGLLEDDEVNAAGDVGGDWSELDQAFAEDVGFSLRQLREVLQLLSQWRAAGGDEQLRFSYSASPTDMLDCARQHLPAVPPEAVEKVVAFLTLDAQGIRRLAGKDEVELDVPVWEHFKRVHRYLIRPLVRLNHERLAWGAATAERAQSIWMGSVANGYLPADLPWPNVSRVVGRIKAEIEAQLEVRAHEICARHTGHALHGIDFRRRFSGERFDDVGDFDVLAYWPQTNLWLAVECKYNQPSHCLKDARRLRERIFGAGADHGQFAKIERRREFLARHVGRLRPLLGWPESPAGREPVFREAYVCRDISWWLKHPPYPVPTAFVRVDALDGWLRGELGALAGTERQFRGNEIGASDVP